MGIAGGGGCGGVGDESPIPADPMNGIITGTNTTNTTNTAAGVVTAVIETNGGVNGGGVSVSYDVIAAISQAHLTNCDYTDELTRTLLRKPVASPVIIIRRERR